MLMDVWHITEAEAEVRVRTKGFLEGELEKEQEERRLKEQLAAVGARKKGSHKEGN